MLNVLTTRPLCLLRVFVYSFNKENMRTMIHYLFFTASFFHFSSLFFMFTFDPFPFYPPVNQICFTH